MKILITNFDDWQGIYVNGRLKFQGHSIPYFEILKAIDISYEDLEVDMYSLNIGRLPETELELREIMERTDE